MRYDSSTDVHLRHNGAFSKAGVVLCIDVDHGVYINDMLELRIIEWVTQALQHAHEYEDAYNCWHFVHGVRHDQWRDGDLALNGLQVTVAYDVLPPSNGYDWPLFPNEDTERPKILAADILEYFDLRNAPPGVVQVGASALSKPRIEAEWRETVSCEDSTFCRPGAGAGHHNMHTIPAVCSADQSVIVQRERLV